jgi:hypothetical protein
MDRFFGRGCLALAIGLGSLLAPDASRAAQPAASGNPVNGEAAETFGLQGPAAPKAAKPVRPTPAEKAGLSLGTLPEVRLQAIDTDALLREDAVAGRMGRVKGLRYGVGRDLQVSVKDGNWYDLADGSRLWAGEIVSTGALGVRLHLRDVRLPAGAELALYAPGGSDPARGIVKSGSPLDDPDREVEFHDASAFTKSQFWTGSFFGDRVRIEYLAPAGEASEALPFAVDRLQHLYLDPVDRLAKSLVGAKDAAGSCENDVTCYPEWQDLSHAVSGIGVIGQDSIFCSGQLLNSQSQDFTPYWLTANHCLESQGEAESSEFYWLYQTAQCNGTPPSIRSVPRSRGAALLSTNPTSDYTLLMVTGALPDGLYWAGWTGKAVPEGTDATAIHHPSGDYKRISFGFKDNNAECYEFRGTDGLQLVRITWTDAVTEPGSSGSGIFRSDTQQLFGQLFFGPSSCGASAADRFDCYGSFVTTYGKIKTFLKGGPDDKSEQNDSCKKARKLNAGTQANRVVKVVDPDWYKVTVPAHRTVTVDLGFSNANGDIDLAAYTTCDSDAVATSTGANDGESVTLTNEGNRSATFYFQVYLNSSTRNTYDIRVSFE